MTAPAIRDRLNSQFIPRNAFWAAAAEGRGDLPDVVVVDDDAWRAEDILYLLRKEGLSAEAYRTAERYLGDRDNPFATRCMVIVVDLPGMDGFELRDELLRMGIDIPTVFVTDCPTTEIARRAAEIGAAGWWDSTGSEGYFVELVLEAVNAWRPSTRGRPAHGEPRRFVAIDRHVTQGTRSKKGRRWRPRPATDSSGRARRD